jgi:hypothetical protein
VRFEQVANGKSLDTSEHDGIGYKGVVKNYPFMTAEVLVCFGTQLPK